MKPLYIIGAGGAAKEIYLLVKACNKLHAAYDFKGFVDISEETYLKIGITEHPIIKEFDFLSKSEGKISVVFGLGDANKIRKIVHLYKKHKHLEFPNLIHPNVILDESVELGEGNIITTQCIFTADISLGSFNYINRAVHVGHDCAIGSYNVINPCAVISGGINIGDENLIGTNATILQYLKIGSKNKIGAGAVVTKNVENGSCMIGVPAKNSIL